MRSVWRNGFPDREHMIALHLSVKNEIVSYETVAIGTISAAMVHPREVFKAAILANAAAVVLVHNHPSGNPEPSTEDRALTERIKRAGELLGIPVLDHVIVTPDDFVSLAARGM
jgi:DNA repair protein RadC